MDLCLVQRLEDDRGVDAIQELRLEGALQLVHDLPDHFVVLVFLFLLDVVAGTSEVESEARVLIEQAGPHIGRHDDDRVAEVDRPALGIASGGRLRGSAAKC